jgi:hypothetical protein
MLHGELALVDSVLDETAAAQLTDDVQTRHIARLEVLVQIRHLDHLYRLTLGHEDGTHRTRGDAFTVTLAPFAVDDRDPILEPDRTDLGTRGDARAAARAGIRAHDRMQRLRSIRGSATVACGAVTTANAWIGARHDGQCVRPSGTMARQRGHALAVCDAPPARARTCCTTNSAVSSANPSGAIQAAMSVASHRDELHATDPQRDDDMDDDREQRGERERTMRDVPPREHAARRIDRAHLLRERHLGAREAQRLAQITTLRTAAPLARPGAREVTQRGRPSPVIGDQSTEGREQTEVLVGTRVEREVVLELLRRETRGDREAREQRATLGARLLERELEARTAARQVRVQIATDDPEAETIVIAIRPIPMMPSKCQPAWTAAMNGSASPMTMCTSSQRPTGPVHASQREDLRNGYSHMNRNSARAAIPKPRPTGPDGRSIGWSGWRSRAATPAR